MPVSAFDKAMKALPERADPLEEIDWIRSHPAMSRLARTGKPVKITTRDVRTSSAGPAPSRSAVIALSNWANMPEKFYQKMLQEHSKAKREAERGGDGEEEVEHDLGDLRRRIAKRLAWEDRQKKDARSERRNELRRQRRKREREKKGKPVGKGSPENQEDADAQGLALS